MDKTRKPKLWPRCRWFEISRKDEIMTATAAVTNDNVPEAELTDGFHLLIDALKLNGIETIYGV
ncbi:MAG: hypothetical protein ACRBM6_32290, partial [Geminicoccales bacterium]